MAALPLHKHTAAPELPFSGLQKCCGNASPWSHLVTCCPECGAGLPPRARPAFEHSASVRWLSSTRGKLGSFARS